MFQLISLGHQTFAECFFWYVKLSGRTGLMRAAGNTVGRPQTDRHQKCRYEPEHLWTRNPVQLVWTMKRCHVEKKHVDICDVCEDFHFIEEDICLNSNSPRHQVAYPETSHFPSWIFSMITTTGFSITVAMKDGQESSCSGGIPQTILSVQTSTSCVIRRRTGGASRKDKEIQFSQTSHSECERSTLSKKNLSSQSE